MGATLAVDGGTPVRRRPFAPWPVFDDATQQAVTDVLRSGRLTYWSGPHGRSLEQRYAASLGRSYAVAVANGTLALELALRAFTIGPGDEVIVPARTFVATASAVVAVGARPVIADIDTASGCLTADTVAAVISPSTKAVIPVHLGGRPVEMDPLLELAEAHRMIVIEDCAQAHGATYKGRRVGATGSHAAAFSFCQDKIISAGEGGLFVCDDEAAYGRAWSYKDHGKTPDALDAPPAPPGSGSCFSWLVDSFGSNWRMPEISAVLTSMGLERLSDWVGTRRENMSRLSANLAGAPGLSIPAVPDHIEHAGYRLYAYVDPERLKPGWSRDRITAAVMAEGVPCGYGTCAEIYREHAFRNQGLAPAGRLPGAAAAHETSIALLVHPTLGAADMDDTAEAVRRVMEAACV